jgi:hypothetical protein
VVIDEDCQKPDVRLASDLIDIATPGKGWVSVTVSRPLAEADWQTRVRHWFFKVFRGDP